MKKIGIVFNSEIVNSVSVKESLMTILDSKNVPVEVFDITEMQSGVDFVLVIGGDGTLIKAARFYSDFGIPVLGINLGRLGFLSQVKDKDIESAIEMILTNRFVVEDRLMIESAGILALNDIVIKGTSSARTSRFYLNINDKFVCDYVADGLIISTPTGSTAYGLSAGGPVLAPCLNSLVIVPICPHTLNARPIVIPADEKISVYSCDNCEMCVTADGVDSVLKKDIIEIKKSEKFAKLALLDDNDFYSVIRNKLHWGVSPIEHK